ncbi:hypothetical protein PR202_ga30779 [Eleusine coracana subsp. coracana]|uniref:Uncharacterized protein n=1 Tax=Eleusine coracana subsp. coracana TaxID=191504 RepID=A0AAV5DPR2_ELECO|nr:hypothetical protein PR202_ga30779 [Eleusine coracana subsp. coracana]
MATPSPLRATLLFLLALPFLSFPRPHTPPPRPCRAPPRPRPSRRGGGDKFEFPPPPLPPPPPPPLRRRRRPQRRRTTTSPPRCATWCSAWPPPAARYPSASRSSASGSAPQHAPSSSSTPPSRSRHAGGPSLQASASASPLTPPASPTPTRGVSPPPSVASRIAKELVSDPELLVTKEAGPPPPRWLVLADDDTAFVLPNLLRALARYDWREPWYLGARSESAAQNAWHGFAMAYGGGGIAVSWPLARRLARALDSCVVRYPHLYGSDARIRACVAELGVELTHEPGFHQIDLHGDISGLLRAHPLSPLVSLHHLDNVYPLYPGMDRTRAMQHFFRAANADPARILQQTVCYDRFRSLTVSIAWGYSVQVFKGNVLLPDLLAVQKTFVPWKRGRNVTDVYMFDTKHYPRDECKRGALFFLKSISSSEGKTETTFNRQPSRKCSPDLTPLRNVNLIKVTSEQLHLVPGKAFRRQCCDIVRSSSDNIMDVNIRKCKDDELIAMHSYRPFTQPPPDTQPGTLSHHGANTIYTHSGKLDCRHWFNGHMLDCSTIIQKPECHSSSTGAIHLGLVTNMATLYCTLLALRKQFRNLKGNFCIVSTNSLATRNPKESSCRWKRRGDESAGATEESAYLEVKSTMGTGKKEEGVSASRMPPFALQRPQPSGRRILLRTTLLEPQERADPLISDRPAAAALPAPGPQCAQGRVSSSLRDPNCLTDGVMAMAKGAGQKRRASE